MTVRRWLGPAVAAAVLIGCSADGGSEGGTAAEQSAATPSTVVASAGTTQAPSGGSGAADMAGELQSQSRCSPDADDGPQSVRIWGAFGGDEAPDAFARLVDEFNGLGTGITVDVERIDRPSELIARLQYTPFDQWPDVVLTSPQSMRRLVDTGRLVAPGDCAGVPGLAATVTDLLPAVDATYRFDGEMQGVPFGVSSTVLFFDAAELRAAGMDPDDPPSTLEELAAASSQVVDTGVSPHGLVVYEWYGTYLLHGLAVQRGLELVSPDNGRRRGAFDLDYQRPEFVEMLQWLRTMITDHGAVSIGRTPSSVEDLLRVVDPLDGAVMTLHSSASLGDVLALVEGGAFPGAELGVGPMPGGLDGAEVGGVGMWLLDRGDPSALAAAAAAVAWLADGPQIARFAAATGYVPPSAAVAAEPAIRARWAERPQFRVAYDQIAAVAAGSAAAGPLVGPNAEFNSRLFDLTLEIVDGADPVAALAEFEADVRALVAQYEGLVAAETP